MTKRDDIGRLELLYKALDDDLLDAEAYTDEEIEAKLENEGFDVEGATRRGMTLVNELLAKRKRKRLHRVGSTRRDDMRDRLDRGPALPSREEMTFDELQREFRKRREDKAYAALFRNRQVGEADEDELRRLLHRMDQLDRLEDDDDGSVD